MKFSEFETWVHRLIYPLAYLIWRTIFPNQDFFAMLRDDKESSLTTSVVSLFILTSVVFPLYLSVGPERYNNDIISSVSLLAISGLLIDVLTLLPIFYLIRLGTKWSTSIGTYRLFLSISTCYLVSILVLSVISLHMNLYEVGPGRIYLIAPIMFVLKLRYFASMARFEISKAKFRHPTIVSYAISIIIVALQYSVFALPQIVISSINPHMYNSAQGYISNPVFTDAKTYIDCIDKPFEDVEYSIDSRKIGITREKKTIGILFCDSFENEKIVYIYKSNDWVYCGYMNTSIINSEVLYRLEASQECLSTPPRFYQNHKIKEASTELVSSHLSLLKTMSDFGFFKGNIITMDCADYHKLVTAETYAIRAHKRYLLELNKLYDTQVLF